MPKQATVAEEGISQENGGESEGRKAKAKAKGKGKGKGKTAAKKSAKGK